MSQPPAGDPGQFSPDYLAPPQPRRGFFTQAAAVVVGAVAGLVPLAVGLATFINPLRRSVRSKQRPSGSDAQGFYKVTTLDALSAIPQAFKIIADRKDAWNTFPKDAIGTVYLSRLENGDVLAFNVTCPHAGCAVDWRAAKNAYHCPCHNSAFAPDGVRDPKSPSARDLDSLEVKFENGAVLVKYQDFKSGEKGKHPT
ncbi:MAG: Rieske 2Fe-2S domain-containing protein [Planctomycetia bacterium]|nr:Rieske 2Fe-2S domain-containing protein [Planctomycetia bacterium]